MKANFPSTFLSVFLLFTQVMVALNKSFTCRKEDGRKIPTSCTNISSRKNHQLWYQGI